MPIYEINIQRFPRIAHTTNQPVFITKNGQGDLAVMSIAQYDKLLEKINLYSKKVYTSFKL